MARGDPLYPFALSSLSSAVASGFGSVVLRHMRPDSSPNASGRSPVELEELLFEELTHIRRNHRG